MIALLLGMIFLTHGVIALTDESSAECPKGTHVARYLQEGSKPLEICWSLQGGQVVFQEHDGRVIATITQDAVE